ncbi:hypothetical protein JG687_00002112 [Phytophthora cactorum]|uniref:Uncharacterized protein n=1 Tax=Phytophthora cactorum TaxID=29920 RepID=A0A8T1UVC2_9STRA|nr:hypothetical protein JG687_00002112 [Phytophthora cactorum]
MKVNTSVPLSLYWRASISAKFRHRRPREGIFNRQLLLRHNREEVVKLKQDACKATDS